METSGFFDSLELEDGSYDRAYIAEQFANFFSLFIGNGVFGSPENQLKVVAKEGLTVTMKKGFAFINGYWYYNDADRDFVLSPNQTATNRTDSIVVRLDLSERKIESLYLLDQDGATRGDNYYELQLASILLKTGAVEITDAEITDKRTDESVCGLVTGILEVIKTNDLFLQFETQFRQWFNSLDNEVKTLLNEFIEESSALLQKFTDDTDNALADFTTEINEWFEEIKGKLAEEDVAASLQLQINEANEVISKNAENIENLQGEVGLLDIQTTTDTTLPDSKEGGLNVNHILGNAEQKSYSGKNLFGGLALANAFVSTGNSGVTLDEAKGTVTYGMPSGRTDLFTDFKENTQYTFIVKVSSSQKNMSDSKPAVNLGIYYTDGSVTYMPLPKAFDVVETLILVSDANKTIDAFSWRTGDTDISTLYYNESGVFEGVLTLDDFEEFVGGTPSPNPSYDQSMNNTGDCVEMMSGSINMTTGAYENSTTYVRNKHALPCKPNDVVAFELERKQNVLIYYYNESGYVSGVSKWDITSTEFTVPNDVTRFEFKVGSSVDTTPQTVGKITLTINGKYVVPIKTSGKDMLENLSSEQGYYDSTGTVVSSTTWKHYSLPIDNSKNYYIKNDSTDVNAPKHCWFDKDNKFISAINYKGTSELWVIPPNNAKYLGLSVYINSACYVHEYHTEYILLDEPLRKVGNVADRIIEQNGVWYVERNVKEVVFNGSEAWSQTNKIDDWLQIMLTMDNKPIVTSECLSDLFSYEEYHKVYNGKMTAVTCDANANVRLSMSDTNVTSLELFKTWLAENPTTVYYILATPIFTPLDTESQKALNRLKTFDTVTYIEIDSVVQPGEVEVQFGTSKVGALTLENKSLQKLLELSHSQDVTNLSNDLTNLSDQVPNFRLEGTTLYITTKS